MTPGFKGLMICLTRNILPVIIGDLLASSPGELSYRVFGDLQFVGLLPPGSEVCFNDDLGCFASAHIRRNRKGKHCPSTRCLLRQSRRYNLFYPSGSPASIGASALHLGHDVSRIPCPEHVVERIERPALYRH